MNPFLILENITIKSIDEIIYQDINLVINGGEQWAVTGNNEAETSTFLQIFMQKFIVTKGKMDLRFYDDHKKNYKSADPLFNHRDLTALVSQKHNFKNLSNTTDFYYQQRYNAHDAEDAPTVQEYLSAIPSAAKHRLWNFEQTTKLLRLSSLLDEHIIKLSNGETKRLLIAAALLKNPLLLLLDHPYTGLDVTMREELNNIIKLITDSGITIILATSPWEIPQSISHVAVIEEKKLKSILPIEKFSPSFLDEGALKEEIDIQISVTNEPKKTFDIIAKLDQVKVLYDDRLILDNISWEVKQGERWALLGPNGAGKTTLLSLINGDNPQSYANKIILFDKKRGSGESIWEIKEKIGFMSPELYQYFPSEFTCIKIVESGFHDSIGLYKKSDPQKASLALEWMHQLKINVYAQKPFNTVPSNIQRVCLLARALVKNPPLLLLDEPCQGLNLHQKHHFKHLIDELCIKKGTTLIYVSHYKEEIPACVTKLLQLSNGRVAYSGSILPEI